MTHFIGNHHQKYRSDIDGLRAVAVLAVVFYHAFPSWITGGFIGVDVFFVISGYLISGIIFESLNNGGFSFVDFYFRRIKRIFPALTVVLISCFIFGWYFLLPNEYEKLSKNIISAAGFFSNFTLLHESGYFDAAAESKPLLHLWSLSIEEQFYLIWPAFLFLLWKQKFNLLKFTLLITTLSFILNVSFVHKYPIEVFYLPMTRFWELSIGGVLAYTELNKRKDAHSILHDIKSFLGIGLILLPLFILHKENIFPGWWALFPTLGAVFLLSAGPQAWFNRKLLSHRILVWFGVISYPLYLWHWPLLSFERILNLENDHEYLLNAFTIIVSIALAWLCYQYIERPIRLSKQNPLKITFVLSSTLVAMVFTAYWAKTTHGFYSRSPQIIQQIDKSWFTEGNIIEGWDQSCFLARDQKPEPEKFAENCLEKNKRPLVFLWGDSHAAALYPGLKFLQTKFDFGIAAHTASVCPPILNWASWYHYYCKEINAANLSLIQKIKPEIVLLHANWTSAHYDMHNLGATVDEIKKAGVSKIILIGPVPGWSSELPNILSSYYKKFRRLPPYYTTIGLTHNGQDTFAADKMLREEAKKAGAFYISAFQTLCNQDGCLMRTGERAIDMTTFDGGHLSPIGSQKFMSLISNKIFESYPRHEKLSAKSLNVQ